MRRGRASAGSDRGREHAQESARRPDPAGTGAARATEEGNEVRPRRRRNLHSGCAGVLGASRPVVESAAYPLRRENCLMERAPYAPLNGRCSSGAWQAPVKDLIRIGFAFRRLQVPHRRVSIAEFFIARGRRQLRAPMYVTAQTRRDPSATLILGRGGRLQHAAGADPVLSGRRCQRDPGRRCAHERPVAGHRPMNARFLRPRQTGVAQ